MKLSFVSRPRLVGLAGLMAVALFLFLVARFWHPVYGFSVFFQLDASNDELKITAFRELPVYVHRDTGPYDGLYYAQIAQDPTLRDPELPRAMDNLSYRARRILPSALAWILGAGQPAWIVHAYSLINVMAWLALALLLWRLLAVRDARSGFAWAGVMFSAGALSSVRLALTDLPALTLIAAALLAGERGRRRLATALLATSGLARETSLLAFAGMDTRPWISLRNLGRGLLVVAPLAAWLVYVRWQVGPADAGWANLAIPGWGLVEKWVEAVGALFTVDNAPLVGTTLLATLGLTVQLAFIAQRPRFLDPWWRIGAAYTVLLLFLDTAVWEGFPGAATRVLLPLQLAFNVLAIRTRAAVVWLVLGNLSVFSGLIALRDVPYPADELATQRVDGVRAIVRFDDGWYGREHTRSHVWLWTGRGGKLSLETLPPITRKLRVEFGLRSLSPRTVVLRQYGREVWRGESTPVHTRRAAVIWLAAGQAELEFATDTPGDREGEAAGGRELAFALYDVTLALPPP